MFTKNKYHTNFLITMFNLHKGHVKIIPSPPPPPPTKKPEQTLHKQQKFHPQHAGNKTHHQDVRNAAPAACAKSTPAQGKRSEMRGPPCGEKPT